MVGQPLWDGRQSLCPTDTAKQPTAKSFTWPGSREAGALRELWDRCRIDGSIYMW